MLKFQQINNYIYSISYKDLKIGTLEKLEDNQFYLFIANNLINKAISYQILQEITKKLQKLNKGLQQ